MQHIFRSLVVTFLFSLTLFLTATDSFSGLKSGNSAVIKPVPTDLVCMVNDEVMNKKQTPVPFEGKMYYGCCPACVTTLKTDRAARYSSDPLTGKEVDKATAFIIAGENGAALYFESAENAQKFLGGGR